MRICDFSSQFLTQFRIKTINRMEALNNGCFNRQFSLSSQPPLRAMPLPRPMETHLWYMIPDEVKGSSLLDQYMDILSPCEKQNVLSFREDELRKRALLARALVRTTIARYQINSCVDPKSIRFKKNSHGKPEVDWQHLSNWSSPPLQFNLSHTSSLVACGITSYSPIGIDVEEKKRTLKHNVMSFARRFFCSHEVEHLANILDPEIQRQEFIKLWTLKEAYVKALGTGFSAAPFKTFRIYFKAPFIDELDVPRVSDSKGSEIYVESMGVPKSKWQFTLLELAGTHYAAICTEKDTSLEENESPRMALRVWKTVPFLEDLDMSGTHSVVPINGFVKQMKS